MIRRFIDWLMFDSEKHTDHLLDAVGNYLKTSCNCELEHDLHAEWCELMLARARLKAMYTWYKEQE